METVEIQERYTKKAVRVQNSSVLEGHGGEARGPDGRDQGRPGAENTVGGTLGNGPQRKADMDCHLCHQKRKFVRECPTNATKGCSGNGQSPPSQ